MEGLCEFYGLSVVGLDLKLLNGQLNDSVLMSLIEGLESANLDEHTGLSDYI